MSHPNSCFMFLWYLMGQRLHKMRATDQTESGFPSTREIPLSLHCILAHPIITAYRLCGQVSARWSKNPYFQAAKALAGANAHLVWGCRNKEKAIQKKEEIRWERIHVIYVDLFWFSFSADLSGISPSPFFNSCVMSNVHKILHQNKNTILHSSEISTHRAASMSTLSTFPPYLLFVTSSMRCYIIILVSSSFKVQWCRVNVLLVPLCVGQTVMSCQVMSLAYKINFYWAKS